MDKKKNWTDEARARQLDAEKEARQNLQGNTDEVFPQYENPKNYPPIGPDNTVAPDPPTTEINRQDIPPIGPDWKPNLTGSEDEE